MAPAFHYSKKCTNGIKTTMVSPKSNRIDTWSAIITTLVPLGAMFGSLISGGMVRKDINVLDEIGKENYFSRR
jgi:uncharacterized Tic20 family protein